MKQPDRQLAAITIDGATGEGGGQVLRTSLSLSIITGRPFYITDIRANRKQPGLRPQHLACVRAAARVSNAFVQGAEVGARTLTFEPNGVQAGVYNFDIGTAGSTTLVLQTVLPPLLSADGPSRVTIVGGTHNPMAPPVEFLRETFLPQVERMGARVGLTMQRPGFYPKGGGRIVAAIEPVTRWAPYVLAACEDEPDMTATALLCGLPEHIAERELAVIQRKLRLKDAALRTKFVTADSPGNAVQIRVASPAITEVFTGFGEKHVSAERVATGVAREVQAYRRSKAPVSHHLADQLLLPMAIGAGGHFRTGPLSLHTRTNMEIIQRFMDITIGSTPLDAHTWEVAVQKSKKGAPHEIS